MNGYGTNSGGRGLGLAAASWRVLREDKSLILVAALSAFCTVLAILAFVIPTIVLFLPHSTGNTFGSSPTSQTGPRDYQIDYVAVFLLYLVMAFIATFFNVALAGAALSRLRGEEGGAMVGFRIALANLPAIAVYAVISATVGIFLRFASRRFGFITGMIIRSVGGVAWGIASFLVVPVIAAERRNPFGALSRSASLLRASWGETLVSGGVIGVYQIALGLLTPVPVLIGFTIGGPEAIGWGIAIAAIYLGVLYIIFSVLDQVRRAAIYLFAESGAVPAGFDTDSLRGAFRAKDKS